MMNETKPEAAQKSSAAVVKRDCLISLDEIKLRIIIAIEHVKNNEFEKAKPHMTKIDEYSFNTQLILAYLSA